MVDVAERCLHGFPTGECLICRTLGATADRPAGRGPTVRSGRPSAGQSTGSSGRGIDPDDVAVPDAVYTVDERRPARSLSSRAGWMIAGLAVVALFAWFVVGLVFAALRLIELVAIAALAGWIGYRLGHRQGRRAARSGR
jgi:hypothetical protein